ncbi:MAG: metallophosphoesterase [Bacteroidaceae bacterium]|nr:metallophosphoesterase [Bacteroidaceae bacterium]
MQSYSSRNNHHITRIINRVGTKLTLFLLALLLGSCATLSHYQGIGRIRRYTLHDKRLPREFDITTRALLKDTHYPSKFTRKRLKNTVRAIGDLSPHLLLLGGDYVTSLAHAEELFAALGNSPTHYGRYAVLGNHDRAIADTLSSIMHRNGTTMLAEESDTLLALLRKVRLNIEQEDPEIQEKGPIS